MIPGPVDCVVGGGAPAHVFSDSAHGDLGNSSYFGFQIVGGWSTCNGNKHPARLPSRTRHPSSARR